ncbi:undecaprenyl-phosphate galactose phosphotransferase [Cricetibacter osteomyelitidis]|uniref:Undecaprenyl-phosphate galactose phosphotransferase n=1 Tax=Cricetibacter osteomyelitidis TaxID=1521931 RepID=A0A4R2SYA6_9PAST|nr:undecaprenyl-phosphate galactose phosphotransferase WbaP [Cricetibacter osteomyelitidis]TCP95519.1 undecaprenyl-phosphate galactose phosphotransferase [Cricetibacter osteomyelitidis]
MKKNEFYGKLILASMDLLSISLSFALSLLMLNLLPNDLTNYLPSQQVNGWLFIHLTLSVICVAWFWIRLRHYSYRKPFWFELKEVIRTLIIFAVIELAIVAFSKLYFSRYLWGFIWVSAVIFVPLFRVLTKQFIIKNGLFAKDLVIIGSGKNALEAYQAISDEKYLGFNIKYFVHQGGENTVKHLGISIIDPQFQDLLSIVGRDTQFTIALEDSQSEECNNWLRYFATHQCPSVSVVPSLRGLPLYSTDMAFLFSHEVILLRINNNLAKRSSRFLKRTMDIFGSLAIITLLSPVLLTLYYLVSKDGGNAIYGHPRIGRNNKEFKCLKFRSMVMNSKEILEKLLAKDPEARAEWEKDFKLKNDPRITKIGRFLRKTSLDELPQLFNVLKGEMSLVGPRPIVKDELERYEEDVDYYLMAKPGMTGLWQVSGRNDVDYETRVYFDSWYVKNWSVWNDIVILFKTVNVVLKRDGAY